VASWPLNEVFRDRNSSSIAKKFRDAYLTIDAIYRIDDELPSLEQTEQIAQSRYPGLDSTQLRTTYYEQSSGKDAGRKVHGNLLRLHDLRLEKNAKLHSLWVWFGGFSDPPPVYGGLSKEVGLVY
jgi:hypothetical protein